MIRQGQDRPLGQCVRLAGPSAQVQRYPLAFEEFPDRRPGGTEQSTGGVGERDSVGLVDDLLQQCRGVRALWDVDLDDQLVGLAELLADREADRRLANAPRAHNHGVKPLRGARDQLVDGIGPTDHLLPWHRPA